MSEKKLDGKVALITGGNKGLGKAMAQALGAAGAKLALVSRDLDLLQSTARELETSGAQVEVFQADVTQEAQVQQLQENVAAKVGRIQILINNAGINIRKPVTDFTLEEWQRVMNTNLTGVFLMCRAFVPQLKGQGYGRIINMTSIMSHVALPERTAYATSKFGLLGFTKALALELIQEKVTVNGISPGPFATEMNQPIIQNADLNKQFVAKIPMGRWGELHEVGQLAMYLCSPEAGFITGTDVLIDGGWTAQ
jgi:NAD(P)-dependent dehydrogenase (short-subunit alcohol dehydrogenase family)